MKTLPIILVITIVSFQTLAQTLTLDSCKSLALENNKRLKEAQLKLKASEKVKQNAFTKYFPNVNASGFMVRSSDYLLDVKTPEMNLPVYDGNPANLPSATQFAYVPPLNIQAVDYANTAMLTAIQPIYAGSQIRNGNKLANLGIEVSQYQLNLSTNQVLVTTETYYWKLVALKEKEKTIEQYRKLLLQLQQEASNAYQAGLVKKSDLLKVQLELNKIKANELKLANGINMLQMVLAQHIGIQADTIQVQDSIVNIFKPESYFVQTSEALKNREEYKMLNKAVEAENLQKKMEMGKHMPQLAVGVGGLYMDLAENKNTYGLAFATLSIPISDWWGASYKLQEHTIKTEIAQNNLEEKSELLQLQISNAFSNLVENYKQISIANLSLKQALEYLQEEQNNYEAGISSTSDLLEARALVQQAQDAVTDSKSIYKIAAAQYQLTIGQVSN